MDNDENRADRRAGAAANGEADAMKAALEAVSELARDTAHHKSVTGLLSDVSRTSAMVDEGLTRLSRAARKPPAAGSASRLSASYLLRAARALTQASNALDLADERHAAEERADLLECARGFLWLAAMDTGAGLALLPEGPRHRRGSGAELLARLHQQHPALPAARLNAMLPLPMDEATARRHLRRIRGSKLS
jgi:hypothetical protein